MVKRFERRGGCHEVRSPLALGQETDFKGTNMEHGTGDAIRIRGFLASSGAVLVEKPVTRVAHCRCQFASD